MSISALLYLEFFYFDAQYPTHTNGGQAHGQHECQTQMWDPVFAVQPLHLLMIVDICHMLVVLQHVFILLMSLNRTLIPYMFAKMAGFLAIIPICFITIMLYRVNKI